MAGLWLVRRALRFAWPVAEELWMHDDVIRDARVRVCIEESDRVSVPVTYGFQPAHILLPVSWREWPAATLRMVLVHELTHASRHDLVVVLLASINQAVFWFHPLAWWLKVHLARPAEHIADERGAAAGPDAESYARVIVGMAEQKGAARRVAKAAACVAGVALMWDDLMEGVRNLQQSR